MSADATKVHQTSQSSVSVSRNAKGGWAIDVKVYADNPDDAATMAVEIAKRVAMECPVEPGK